ncbi:MAG TPA: hypothetical protein VN643_13715 [Pyrinomonadaceae bacterium]|nr:hypothetical protein [Pyrinomonadaceae bacterium]
MLPLILLDVRPDPPQVALGIGVLIVLVLAILAISAALIGGLVFLMMRRRKNQTSAAPRADLVTEV